MNNSRFASDQSTSCRPAMIRKESTELTVTVKHIPATINLQALIDFATQFGVLRYEPHIGPCTERLQKIAFLTFTEQSAVRRCMDGNREGYTINGHPVYVQRWLPIGLTFERSYRLLVTIETDNSDCALTENDLRTYFDIHYGQTNAFTWRSSIVATIDFADYDSIDRAIMTSITHTINGVKVRIEKVRCANVRAAYEQTVASNDIRHCVHVRNIPANVSGEQIAKLFDSNVWDILIRKGFCPDVDPQEAWIMNISLLSDAEQLAKSVKRIENVNIQCTAENEPLNEWTLCGGNRDGWCKHGKTCIYRHVFCTAGDACANEECPFSHSKQRKIVPNPRCRPPGPVESHYRIKIDGLPYTMTATELLAELKNQPLSLLKFMETPEIPPGTATRHFYLVKQAAEKLARKRVFEWHNYPIRESYVVKCQLEYDRLPMTERSSNLSSSSAIISQTNNQRLRSIFAPLSPGDDEICGMPSEWIWTNRRLGKPMSNVYLVYPSPSTNDRLGAIKVYQQQTDLESMRAKRELLALRALENELSVATVYQSNILDGTLKKDEPMWIITQVISELTLEDFVNKYKCEITFHKALLLTRQILEIIQRCHKHHIIHRNLQPTNIMVQQNYDQMSGEEVKPVLIDFSLAWSENQELSITEEEDLNILDHVLERYSNKNLEQLSTNTFSTLQHALPSLSKYQRCSPKIDSTNVCYILFWLLADRWPNQIQYTICPHRENENLKNIHEKLGDAQNDTGLCEQIVHLFDRAFGSFDKWWSVDELLNHLNTIDTLFMAFETTQLDVLFPTTAITKILPLTDPYARIVALIARIKQQFVQQYSTCFKWSDGNNKWSNKNKDIEVRNTDELVYDYQGQQCTISIICFAKIESDQTILFLGTIVKEEMAELKSLYKVNRETNDMDVSECFNGTLKKLARDKLKQTCSSP